MVTLAVVPARGGSKSIPHKNTREYRGLPLIGHAIRAGLETCDQTIVTTDDADIACLAATYGVRVIMRPETLAQDETPMLPVLQHVLRNVDALPDRLVLLQPTSPNPRRTWRVLEALAIMGSEGPDSVASVVRVPDHSAPEHLCQIDDGDLWPAIGYEYMDSMATRRQDCRPAYRRDGTVYVFTPAIVLAGKLYGERCVPLVIPPSESVTLDTEEDWTQAEARK